MKKSPLKMIDATEQLSLSRSGALANAKALRDEVSRRLTSLNPAAIVSLAMSRHPDQPAALALVMLKGEASELLDVLAANGEQLQSAVDAERARLTSVVAASAHRSLEIVGRVSNIDARVAGIKQANGSKRERLRKAGLNGAELENASAPTDYAELLAERAAILVENEALENFLKTRDVRCLPEGFAAEVRETA